MCSAEHNFVPIYRPYNERLNLWSGESLDIKMKGV